MTERKISWAGVLHRRRLHRPRIGLQDHLGLAGSAGAVDDILDAAIAARTARRVPATKPTPYPTTRILNDGIACAIRT